jgi:hypothetical protein
MESPGKPGTGCSRRESVNLEDYNFSLLVETAMIQAGLKTSTEKSRAFDLPLCVFSAASIVLSLVIMGLLNG